MGDSASATPSEVATPLPPRPRRNSVNMCPTIAAPPAAAITFAGKPKRRPSHTGTKPLAASAASTATAQPLPIARATFVAPMLPLPTWRRSIPLARARSIPKGIEPAT